MYFILIILGNDRLCKFSLKHIYLHDVFMFYLAKFIARLVVRQIQNVFIVVINLGTY